jgi:hypothetical protein
VRTSRVGWVDVATRSQVVSLFRAGLRPAEICERLNMEGESEENAVRRICDDLSKSKTPGWNRGFLSTAN